MSVSLSLKPKNSDAVSEGDQTCATTKEFSKKVTGSIAVISLIRWPFPEKSVETNGEHGLLYC